MKYFVFIIAHILLVTYVDSKSAPVAVFHGLSNSCSYSRTKNVVEYIANQTGSVVKCIEIGSRIFGSWYMGMEKQAKEACKKILRDPDFDEEFSVLGISQGALLARYIIEKCDTKYPVRNYVSVGGPHFGVASVPHCSSGTICKMINWAVHQVIYNKYVQKFIGPAGYYRDISHLDVYKKNSRFLAVLNNEIDDRDERIKEKFSSLNKAVFIMFEDDKTMSPPETAIFGELQKDKSIIPVTETQLYIEDWIGLRELNEQGKLTFMSLAGGHVKFTEENILEHMVPVLLA